MGPVISRLHRAHFKSHWAVWSLRYRHSSPRRKQKMIQKVIQKEVASDPEAASPNPGAMPMWASALESESIDDGYFREQFGTTPAPRLYGLDSLKPRGVSSQAKDIWSKLKELEQGYSKRVKGMPFGPHRSWIKTKHLDERLHVILDPFIQDTVQFLQSHGCTGQPRLRRGYKKGHHIADPRSGERYLIAQTTHTVGFEDNCGNMRDYFVIMVDERLKGLDSLVASMCIIHQNRKSRGESNSVVYGLHTNTYSFNFYKIDSESQFYDHVYIYLSDWYYPFGKGKDPETEWAALPEWMRSTYKRLYWDSKNGKWRAYMSPTEDVVTFCENIMEDGVKDCCGIVRTRKEIASSSRESVIPS